MTSLARRNSSIHKVREYQLDQVQLETDYEVLQLLQEGWKGKILLVEHRKTRKEVVLKAMHKDVTTRLEFFKEFHYNYYLSPHENILNAYDVSFQAGDYFVFAQEFAPFGDLTNNMTENGIGEVHTKRIANQLSSALEFMHSKELVHRDITMDNVLVFKLDFSLVKLCDFGSTKKSGSLIKKKIIWLTYAPPEIVDILPNEGYNAEPNQDVWQLAVLIYVLLTGGLPWIKADMSDPNYSEYISWRKRKILRLPKRFSNFTTRCLRMFKRLLDPKHEKRSSITEIHKYMEDKWLVRAPRRMVSDADNQSVCYSSYSLHSSKLEKDIILKTLKEHGIETTVDRAEKRSRINEWLESSVAKIQSETGLKRNSIIQTVEEEGSDESQKTKSSSSKYTDPEPVSIKSNGRNDEKYASKADLTNNSRFNNNITTTKNETNLTYVDYPVDDVIENHSTPATVVHQRLVLQCVEPNKDTSKVILSVGNIRRCSDEAVSGENIIADHSHNSRSASRSKPSPQISRRMTPKSIRKAPGIATAVHKNTPSPTRNEVNGTHQSPSRSHLSSVKSQSSPHRKYHSPVRPVDAPGVYRTTNASPSRSQSGQRSYNSGSEVECMPNSEVNESMEYKSNPNSPTYNSQGSFKYSSSSDLSRNHHRFRTNDSLQYSLQKSKSGPVQNSLGSSTPTDDRSISSVLTNSAALSSQM